LSSVGVQLPMSAMTTGLPPVCSLHPASSSRIRIRPSGVGSLKYCTDSTSMNGAMARSTGSGMPLLPL
jgi:hypothetical protein